VHAYRLVAVETIEEKVLALQEHKRTLVRSVFSANAEPRMSVELLRQLLA
jgi:SNF2 family DNA or RNA helicase